MGLSPHDMYARLGCHPRRDGEGVGQKKQNKQKRNKSKIVCSCTPVWIFTPTSPHSRKTRKRKKKREERKGETSAIVHFTLLGPKGLERTQRRKTDQESGRAGRKNKENVYNGSNAPR